MRALILIASLFSFIIIPNTVYAVCKNCPPFYCEDPAAAKKALERKKDLARKSGLPERLIKLFDRSAKCLGCIENAPDWVHITWSYDKAGFKKDRGREAPNYDRISVPWSADIEKELRSDMRRGVVKEFHILHYSGPVCKCCNDTSKDTYIAWQEEQYASDKNIKGYNQSFDFHPDVAISYTDPKQLGKDPKDLTDIPESFKRPDSLKSPPVSKYMDPAIRVVQVMCTKCQKLADEYNIIGTEINDMRRPIAKLKRNLYYDRQLISWVWMEIEGINKAAVTKKTDKKRASLYEELKGHQNSLERHKKRLKDKIKKREELKLKLEAVMKTLLDCEGKACKPIKDGACKFPEKNKSITIGPNNKFGKKAHFNKKMKNKAKGMVMGGFKRKMGGAVGFGSGKMPTVGGGSSQKGPKKDKDPTKGDFTKISNGKTNLKVRAGWNGKEFVVSTDIKKTPGDGTFHAQWIVGSDGKIYFPKRYLLIDLYRNWKLTVWWTYDRWVNGDHVEHREGDSMTVGTDYLGQFKFLVGAEGVKNSIWNSMGFETAVKGIKHLGTVFDLPPAALKGPCPVQLVTHISNPKEDPVTTTPVISYLFPKQGNGGQDGITVKSSINGKKNVVITHHL